MIFFYLLLFLFSIEITAKSEITTQKKSALIRKKKGIQKNITTLQNKMLYEEANAEEPAKLYGLLEELHQVNLAIKKISRS